MMQNDDQDDGWDKDEDAWEEDEDGWEIDTKAAKLMKTESSFNRE